MNFKMVLSVTTLLGVLVITSGQVPEWFDGPCGESQYIDAGEWKSLTRIVNGYQAREFEFPWQVSLRWKNGDRHLCGGAIINARWILTAGHCVKNESNYLTRPDQLVVAVGEHTLNQQFSTMRQRLDIERSIVHRNYFDNQDGYDIALIKTFEMIKFNDAVQPACGPDARSDYRYKKAYTSGWGSGWNQTGGPYPQTLRYTRLNITDDSVCQIDYKDENGIAYYTRDMLCTVDERGGLDSGACSGDSGGPLVVKESSGRFSLVGITSFGVDPCVNAPNVFTRVGILHDWILNIIKS